MVVAKCPLAGICVVFVMYLVRVVVCMVLDLFVERCDGVVIRSDHARSRKDKRNPPPVAALVGGVVLCANSYNS